MENRPAFFMFFIPHFSANKLKIPRSFTTRCIQEALPENVTLRDRYNNLWQVKVHEFESNWYFKDGWKKFVKDNLIKGGDLIVFDYFGQGFFGIKIYGSNACETKGVGGPIRENTEEHEKDDGHEKQLINSEAGSSANSNGTKRNFDWYGDQIFQSGLVPRPTNPYFVTKVRRNRKYELYIPMDVINDNKLELPEVVTFVDPQGREFPGERKVWKDGRILYVKGWKSLCNVNRVGNEDKCICEFIRRGDGDLSISVTVVRADRQ